MPPQTPEAAWTAFVAAARAYAPYMDQWDKFKFQAPGGMIYVTIRLSDPYPDSFDEIAAA
jgi:hypothetical protein